MGSSTAARRPAPARADRKVARPLRTEFAGCRASAACADAAVGPVLVTTSIASPLVMDVFYDFAKAAPATVPNMVFSMVNSRDASALAGSRATAAALIFATPVLECGVDEVHAAVQALKQVAC